MVVRRKSSPGSLLLIAMTLAIAVATACRNRQPAADGGGDAEPSGEPEQYSATIVRTVDDGTARATITREARSGEKRREEWMEEGHNRALIWRPDLGKCYLLDLDQRLYVELETAPHHANESQAEAKTLNQDSEPTRSGSADSLVQAIDRAIDDAPSPARVETRLLPDKVIDGHSCRVYQNRASFPDGHFEIIRAFRARDFAGLALRIESESEPAATKVTTERRDVRLDVAPDAFVVPADFKKVDKLAR